jgi:hypothetical protein
MTGSIASDRCLEYINAEAQASERSRREERAIPLRHIVTISRQAGSGAHVVAEELVTRLQARASADPFSWKVFDRNLVQKVLEEHDLPDRMARFMPEDRISAITDTLDELFGLRPSSWTLVRKTADTILHLAELGNVVLIGRAGNIVTQNLANAFHVRLVGSSEQRILHVQGYRHLDREGAAAYVRDEDIGRKRYVETYYSKDIEDPLLYHLMINTDRVPYDEAGRLIADAVSGHYEGSPAAAAPGGGRLAVPQHGVRRGPSSARR